MGRDEARSYDPLDQFLVHRVNRRRLLQAGFGVAAAGLLAPWQRSAGAALLENAAKGPAFSKPPTGLVLQTFPTNLQSSQKIEQIYKKQFGVSANTITVPSDYYSTTETRFLGGKPPFDVLDFDPGFIAKFVQNKWIAPLDGLPGAAKMKKDMYPSALEACSLNGKLYALPQYTNIYAMFYNQEVLSKNGLKPAQTWEEMLSQGQFLKSKGLDAPIVPVWTTKYDLTHATFVSDCISRGMTNQFNKSLDPLWDKNPIALQVLNYWKKLLDLKLVPPDALTIDHHQSSSVMQAGQSAYFWFNSYEIQNLNKKGASPAAGKIRAMLMPGKTHATSTFTSPTFQSHRHDPEQAWPLASFLSGLDKNGKYTGPILRIAVANASLLGYKSASRDPRIAKAWSAFTTKHDLAVFSEQLNKSYGEGPVLNEAWYSDYNDLMTKTLSTFLAGGISAHDALSQTAQQVRKMKKKH